MSSPTEGGNPEAGSQPAQAPVLHRRTRFIDTWVPKQSIGAEIGVHKGQFSRELMQVAQPSLLHLIDPWYMLGKEWKWAQGERSTVLALCGVLRRFEDDLVSGRVKLHVGFSWEVLSGFPDAYFDWVYLDSSHAYEHTMRELAILALKVKPEGIITGDDWRPDAHPGLIRAVRDFVAREPFDLLHASENGDLQWAIRRKCPSG